jgi:putative endonuclease
MYEKNPCVYILASKRNGTLYTGVTGNLPKRIDEHKSDAVEGFTKKYQVHTLVYAEACGSMEQAITREKQIKSGSRKKKIELIEIDNPNWEDISRLV